MMFKIGALSAISQIKQQALQQKIRDLGKYIAILGDLHDKKTSKSV
jgi:hypothetical protein